MLLYKVVAVPSSRWRRWYRLPRATRARQWWFLHLYLCLQQWTLRCDTLWLLPATFLHTYSKCGHCRCKFQYPVQSRYAALPVADSFPNREYLEPIHVLFVNKQCRVHIRRHHQFEYGFCGQWSGVWQEFLQQACLLHVLFFLSAGASGWTTYFRRGGK